jgi:two-component system nitrogen regulation sensor histidine kinase NtrY
LQKFIQDGKKKHDEATRYSGMVADEAERLIKLTDGFMRFTKLNPPELKPTSVTSLCKEMIDRFKQVLPKGVDLEVDCERNLPQLMLDAAQISIAIDHLIDNAIAAVSKNGKIAIKVLLVERQWEKDDSNKVVEIRIIDTGPGIPKKYHTKIFEPYFSLKEGGTGLGLAMVKKIIQDHGGTVSLESSKGHGSTFIITLPVRKDEG